MAADSSKTLLQLLGAYDNLSEPEPVANRPETIVGLALSFLVRMLPRRLFLPPRGGCSRSRVLARLWANTDFCSDVRQVVTWICVSLRIYTRYFVIYAPWWDDLFVVLVLVSAPSLPCRLFLSLSLPLSLSLSLSPPSSPS